MIEGNTDAPEGDALSGPVTPIAVITGAAAGLGREIACELHARGYGVAIGYRTSAAEAGKLVRSLGSRAMACPVDMRKAASVKELAARVFAAWGRVDALINNAAIADDALLLKCSEEGFRETIETNTKGCFLAIQAFTPSLIGSGGGHIVNISSRSGRRGKAGQSSYSASKAALLGLTYAAARELAPHAIRVNAVLPGYMATPMGAGAAKALAGARKESLLGRLTEPGEVAGFVAYLLSTKSVTGQVFSIDSRV